MLALRPYTPPRMVLRVGGHCFREDPQCEVEYQTGILQGHLIFDGWYRMSPAPPAYSGVTEMA